MVIPTLLTLSQTDADVQGNLLHTSSNSQNFLNNTNRPNSPPKKVSKNINKGQFFITLDEEDLMK